MFYVHVSAAYSCELICVNAHTYVCASPVLVCELKCGCASTQQICSQPAGLPPSRVPCQLLPTRTCAALGKSRGLLDILVVSTGIVHAHAKYSHIILPVCGPIFHGSRALVRSIQCHASTNMRAERHAMGWDDHDANTSTATLTAPTPTPRPV